MDSTVFQTYNTDAQTADSAGTATAYLSGVKTNLGVLGVDARVFKGDCESMVEGTMLDSIFEWSKAAGKFSLYSQTLIMYNIH